MYIAGFRKNSQVSSVYGAVKIATTFTLMPSYFVMPSYFYIHSCTILTQQEPLMLYRDTLCKEALLYGYTLMKGNPYRWDHFRTVSVWLTVQKTGILLMVPMRNYLRIYHTIASQHNHHIATLYITILFSSIQYSIEMFESSEWINLILLKCWMPYTRRNAGHWIVGKPSQAACLHVIRCCMHRH